MAEMTKKQMEELLERQEETMEKAKESPDFTAAPKEVPVPKDRPKNLKDFVEEVFKKDSSFTRDPFADATEEEKEEAEAELKKQRAKKAGGGSVEKEADFVKDDDEEPADPPPGATPEEVADDIPAYLSTGEYVLPANVVRYIGLQQIVAMHKGALSELQQMEDLDIIENVDENGMVEEDDDEMDYLKEPKGVVKTTLVVAKPHPSGMMAMPFAQGGAPGGPDDTGAASDIGEDTSMEGFDLDIGDGSAYGDQGFGTGLDEGGEDKDEDTLGLGTGSKDAAKDDSTQQTIENLLEQNVPNYGKEDIEPGILNAIDGVLKSAEKKLGDMRDKGQLVTGSIVGDAFIGLMSGIVDKARESGATIGDSDPAVDDTSIGGGEDSGLITEEKLEGDEDKNQEETDFVFQPGVGFIPKRRGIRRVQALRETDLPTARRGGLMGY